MACRFKLTDMLHFCNHFRSLFTTRGSFRIVEHRLRRIKPHHWKTAWIAVFIAYLQVRLRSQAGPSSGNLPSMLRLRVIVLGGQTFVEVISLFVQGVCSMKKMLRGMLFAGAISVLSIQGAFAAWGSWTKPSSWGRTTTTTPTTPPPTTTTTTTTTTSTGGSTGGGTPAVPEPGTMLLMGSGAAALAYARRRQSRKAQE
jgi:hypothetical protein